MEKLTHNSNGYGTNTYVTTKSLHLDNTNGLEILIRRLLHDLGKHIKDHDIPAKAENYDTHLRWPKEISTVSLPEPLDYLTTGQFMLNLKC